MNLCHNNAKELRLCMLEATDETDRTRYSINGKPLKYRFHDFQDFHEIWSLKGRHMSMAAARHREATDMRLAPFDSLYIKVSRKIMRSQNKLRDFEIS